MNRNMIISCALSSIFFVPPFTIAGERSLLTKNGEQILRDLCQKNHFYDFTIRNFDFYKTKYSEFLAASKETSSPMDSATNLINKYWDIEDKERESRANPNETDQSKLFASFLFKVQLETSRTLFLKHPLAKDRQFLQSEAKSICLQNVSQILGVNVGR
jgi:hypothetical protein